VAVSSDNFGVIWSAWGGPGYPSGVRNTGGDNTQLPSSQSTPNVSQNYIAKFFGNLTATLASTLPPMQAHMPGCRRSVFEFARSCTPSGANNDGTSSGIWYSREAVEATFRARTTCS